MIIYSVITTYHLLEAIVHKVNYNLNEHSILFVSNWLVEKYPWYEKLDSFFDEVYVFDGSYRFQNYKKTVSYLNSYFKNLFKKLKFDLNKATEINVFGAEHAFGAFLFVNKVPVNFWEEGAGALSKKESMCELFAKVHGIAKARFQTDLHLGDGEQPFVKKRFYNRNYQLKEVLGTDLVHFDIGEELQKMNQSLRNELIGLFYPYERIKACKKDVLLLTECFTNINININIWEEQILLYKYLKDYFFNDYDMIIKTHPDDLVDYEDIFKRSRVIRKKFPAELLPFIFNGNPGMVATSSSTSIYGLRKLYDRLLEFNFEFSHQKQFYLLNRYYIALNCIFRYLKSGYKLNLLGINPVIIENFVNFYDFGCKEFTNYTGSLNDFVSSSEKTVWLVDVLPESENSVITDFLEKLPADDIVVFINSKDDYIFYNENKKYLWKYIHPICITETKTGNYQKDIFFKSCVKNVCHKFIYLFSKGIKMDQFNCEKDLPEVGITVSAESFNAKDEKIKILEGMLQATERRLNYYIDKEKKSNEEN